MKKLFALFCLVTPTLLARQIPASKRSEQAVKTNNPLLQAAFDEKKLQWGNPVFIRIFKQTSELELWVKKGGSFEVFKTYKICYFSGHLGTKTRAGDNQAPEGFYTILPGQMNPNSNYHLAFNIGYPNSFDRANGYTGSHIMIHGNCVSIGCFAMTDAVIEELWTIVNEAFRNKQKAVSLHIFPFRFSSDNLEAFREDKNMAFWNQLLPAYRYFESSHKLPVIGLKGKKYTVAAN